MSPFRSLHVVPNTTLMCRVLFVMMTGPQGKCPHRGNRGVHRIDTPYRCCKFHCLLCHARWRPGREGQESLHQATAARPSQKPRAQRNAPPRVSRHAPASFHQKGKSMKPDIARSLIMVNAGQGGRELLHLATAAMPSQDPHNTRTYHTTRVGKQSPPKFRYHKKEESTNCSLKTLAHCGNRYNIYFLVTYDPP